MSKIQKFVNALEKGQAVTYKQMISRFGYVSKNSASGRVVDLREKYGYDIVRLDHSKKPSRFALRRFANALRVEGYTVAA
jgi:hypothetical protein